MLDLAEITHNLAISKLELFNVLPLIGDPRFNYKGEDVVETLERVCGKIGYPNTIRVDNGSEFISPDLDLWA